MKLWESSNKARLCNVTASEADLTSEREERGRRMKHSGTLQKKNF